MTHDDETEEGYDGDGDKDDVGVDLEVRYS